MPSGAKKRKAAKKKKEKETHTNPSSTNNPQGNDEVKSQDDKGSDGGEGGSPAYHDHDDDHHHHPFNEGNEEVEEGNSSAAQPSAADADADDGSVEEVPVDIKIEEDVRRTEDGGVVIERALKSEENCESKDISVVHTRSAKESDYENGNCAGRSNVETVVEKNLKDETNNTVKESATYDELVKSIDSMHAKMMHVTDDAPVEETGNAAVESSVDPVKPSGSVSEVRSSDAANSLIEKPSVSQLGTTEFDMKKNEENNNVRASSVEETKPKESNDMALQSVSRSPLPESTNGTEHVKDSDIPEPSENQPLVAPSPLMAQKTSWLSCCGLLEVLSGSNR